MFFAYSYSEIKQQVEDDYEQGYADEVCMPNKTVAGETPQKFVNQPEYGHGNE
jgi:hypothetical protein